MNMKKRLKKAKKLVVSLFIGIFVILGYVNDIAGVHELTSNYNFRFLSNSEKTIKEKLILSKIEALNYKLPNSQNSIVKFIGKPTFNYINNNKFKGFYTNHAMLGSISPIKSQKRKYVFDGGDCRFSSEAVAFDEKSMTGKILITNITCIDNSNIGYTLKGGKYLGYISMINKPGISSVKVISEDGLFTVDSSINYIAELYSPISSFVKQGVSIAGRF